MRGVCFIKRPDIDQSSAKTLLFFHHDHLRIDQVLALLQLRQKNKKSIWMFYLFISSPISVTLLWCFHKRSSKRPKQYWCKVTSWFRQTKRQPHKLCLPPLFFHSSLSLQLIWILHHGVSYSFISLLSLLWLFFPPSFHHHLSLHLKIWHRIYFSPSSCFRPACRTSIKRSP